LGTKFCLDTFGFVSALSTLFGHFWLYLDTFGSIWTLLALFGFIKLKLNLKKICIYSYVILDINYFIMLVLYFGPRSLTVGFTRLNITDKQI
jgi:hypothetical protein